MELKTAIEILQYHQEWRQGKRDGMIHSPAKLTQALDIVIELAVNHRSQIEKAWWAGHDERDGNEMIHPSEDCNQYYNETYGK